MAFDWTTVHCGVCGRTFPPSKISPKKAVEKVLEAAGWRSRDGEGGAVEYECNKCDGGLFSTGPPKHWSEGEKKKRAKKKSVKRAPPA